MRLFVVLLLIIPIISQSQEKKNLPVDSVAYYEKELQTLSRETYEKMRNSERYKTAVERLQHYKSLSDEYSAFVMFGDFVSTDFHILNASIVQKGFNPITGTSFRFGIGFSRLVKRKLFDFYFFSLGIPMQTKKGEEKIRTNFSGGLMFDLGYDLIKSRKINIYPYAGLALRTTDLSYTKPTQLNGSFTDITDLVQNNQSVSASSFKAGYQAGVGFELAFGYNSKDYSSGTIFFIKAGTSRSIGKETYKTGGIKYRPGIKYGELVVTVGIKFFSS